MAQQAVDVASLFSSNPIQKLRGEYQSRLLNRVREAFTTDQQSLFLASFYCYLKHHPTDDYVVDLDGVWQWLGYSRKDAAKRKLLQFFLEGRDYHLLHFKVEQSKHGGHNRETILMNVETFKAFCMLSETQKGFEVRSYYIKLETMLQDVVQEQTAELEEQLKAEIAEKNDLKLRLETGGRRYAASVKREMVYIFRETDNLHKIGKTGNIKAREAAASTFSYSGTMRHAVACVNSSLLESVVHHMLDKRRLAKRQEWFAVTLDEAKAALEAAQLLLDDFLEAPEKLVELLPILRKAEDILEPPAPVVPEPPPKKRKHEEDAALPLYVTHFRDAGRQREGFTVSVPGHRKRSFYGGAYTLEQKLAQATAHSLQLLGKPVDVEVPPKSDQEGRNRRKCGEDLPKYLNRIDAGKKQGYGVAKPGAPSKSFVSCKLSMQEKLQMAAEYLAMCQ